MPVRRAGAFTVQQGSRFDAGRYSPRVPAHGSQDRCVRMRALGDPWLRRGSEQSAGKCASFGLPRRLHGGLLWGQSKRPGAMACLKRNARSPGCRAALAALGSPSAGAKAKAGGAKAGEAKSAGAKSAGAKSAARPAPPSGGQAGKGGQESAIRSACRSDFMRYCSGVKPKRLCGNGLPAAKCQLAVS